MINLQFQYKHLSGFLSEEEIYLMQDEVDISHSMLVEKAGKGNRFLGWMDIPLKTDETLISSIESDAKAIREKAEILVVIGIGGAHIGSKAIIEALLPPFSTFRNENPTVIYAGNNLSQDYHAALLHLLDNKEYAIVVISKSGITTETAIAFRLLKKHIEKKYGAHEAARRIISITDSSKGALKGISEKHGYKTYVLPDDVNGQFSILTPAGLLPVAIAGYNIRDLLMGAGEMRKLCIENSSLADNPAACYASIRNSLYRLGSQVEILANYEPSLHSFTEWWKQLFAESDGKENEGLFPACADYTTDLFSIGQYIQQGQRMLFETVIHIQKSKHVVTVPFDDADLDGLNYIAGKTLHDVNKIAALGTTAAHIDSEVPCLDILLPVLDERSLGELIYFFEFAVALSGYLTGINPFIQNGVEVYKNNLFALLGKPGFENETETLRERFEEE